MTPGVPGRFVGIGVDHYRSDELPDLVWPVADVRRVRSLLGAAYDGDPLIDPDGATVFECLGTGPGP